MPAAVRRALTVALTARLAQFVEAFLAVLLVSDNGADTATVAVVLLAQQAGATLGASAAGEWIDRRGAREALAVGLLFAGVSAIALGLLRSPGLLVLAATTYGATSSGWRLAVQAGVARGLADSAEGADAADLRARAFGALVWVSNAGTLLSAGLALAGVPLRAAFIGQGAASIVAAFMTVWLPRWRTAPASRSEQPRLERGLLVVALACVPSTIIMFQAFSGLAIVYDEGPYRAMVLTNAIVLVLGQPLMWVALRLARAGDLLSGATLALGVGVACGAIFRDVVASTVVWSFAELIMISLTAGVVAGLAPHRQMGRYQAVFQVIQGAVAAAGMFAGPLLAGGGTTDFALACLVLSLAGAIALRWLSTVLTGAMDHPVACPCGARLCRCDAGHLSCNSPSTVLIHEATPGDRDRATFPATGRTASAE